MIPGIALTTQLSVKAEGQDVTDNVVFKVVNIDEAGAVLTGTSPLAAVSVANILAPTASSIGGKIRITATPKPGYFDITPPKCEVYVMTMKSLGVNAYEDFDGGDREDRYYSYIENTGVYQTGRLKITGTWSDNSTILLTPANQGDNYTIAYDGAGTDILTWDDGNAAYWRLLPKTAGTRILKIAMN